MSASKTKYMCVNMDGEEAPLKVNGQKIDKVDRFVYLGSVIRPDCTIDDAVSANCLKARVQLKHIRAALRCSSLNWISKSGLLNTFISPVLLYGLETVVLRQKDITRLEAVMHSGKRMILGLTSRKDIKLIELNATIRTREIGIVIATRRLSLYASYKNLGDSALMALLAPKKVYSKDFVRQIKLDMINHDLANDWFDAPTQVEYNQTARITRMVGTRLLTVKCENEGCERMFAERKEMNRHLRQDHVPELRSGQVREVTLVNLIMASNVTVMPSGPPFECPRHDCLKSYKTVGWMERHVRSCHPDIVLEYTKAECKQESGKPNARVRGQSETASSEFSCPLCPKRLGTLKGITNHCAVKHRWSYSQGKEVRPRAKKVIGDPPPS